MADPTYTYPPTSDPGPINDSRYKSIPVVEDADGTFHNISDGSPMPTRAGDFQDEVKRGMRVGVTGWNKFGYRQAVPNNTTACIWPATPLLPTFLTSASTFTVTYNSTTDGSGTTGATELVFVYVDADGLPATTTHTLGSDGSDVTSFSGLGINRIAVTAAGSAGFNTNDITVTATTGATVQAVVPAEGSITQQAIFFVGANHVAIAPWLTIEMSALNKDKALALIGYTWNRASGVRTEIFRGSLDRSLDLHRQIADPIKFRLEPSTVLYFVGTTSGHNSVIDMQCRFSLNEYQVT
tara:strand:+ start:1965 stop:2852 length:888 start_codon:yes stop_codon:yes gene_type:complete